MFQGNFRLNHAAPPFDDPAVRRVVWKLVDQASMLEAIGVPARYAVTACTSFFMCGSPLESKVGAEPFSYSVDAAREELKKTQVVCYDLTPAVSWGQFTIPAAYRTSLAGLAQSSFPMFWEVSKSA